MLVLFFEVLAVFILANARRALRTLIVSVLVVASSGCMVPCGDEPPRLTGPSPGNRIYCAIREGEKQKRERQAKDVALCIEQGGDPVGCRAAVGAMK
jgi:hypothetical protein